MTVTFRQVVLDATDNRALAEFYRQLVGLTYREGDEPGGDGDPEFIVLSTPQGTRIAFQQVPALARATWPDGPVPQQLHLDFSVSDRRALDEAHERALDLGSTLVEDRSDDEEEPLRVYADPAGHPFCLFVAAPNS